MLFRINDFAEWFKLPPEQVTFLQTLADTATRKAEGMTHYRDYLALGSVCLARQPATIFEIGTYLGVTSDFFLSLLPEVKIVSIAYVSPFPRLFGQNYNNSELRRSQVGSAVNPADRGRFVQLYGDSHKLLPGELLTQFGPFDLFFIDGDHSREGVAQDTTLAQAVLSEKGTICWHDANPKERYQGVRDYLEEMPAKAVATEDNYIGGVACWSPEIEERLSKAST
ncbi:MAG: class I SAM-dependent methyltransferase [Brevefilum sp.]